MNTSHETDLIDAALAKAQAELENPTKTGLNPHLRSKYATLDAGLNIARSVLSKHGISITQPTGFVDGVLVLYTRAAHAGQWIQSEYPVCSFPIKQQEMGSALTYSRRYSLFSLIGMAGEDEDDGHAAASPVNAPKRTSKVEAPQLMSPEESAEMCEVLLNSLSLCGTVDELKKWAGLNSEIKQRMRKTDYEVIKTEFEKVQDKLKGKAA